jgi:hypothetical protein
MKNLYLFILLSLSQFAIAQNVSYRLDSMTSPGSSSQVYTYNANNQHIKTENFQFDMASGAQQFMDQITYTYDGNGRVIEQVFSSVMNGVLIPNVKTLISYNASGDILSFTNLWYDGAAATYWNSQKTDYVRDANGNVLQELFFNWQNSAWTMSGKNRYMYNVNNLAISATMTSTIDNGLTFDSLSKVVYTYNANNQPIEELFYNWQNTSWVELNKTSYAYDGAGNVNLVIYYNPQGMNNWVENFKEELTHNVAGDYVQYISYTKNGNNWDPQFKLINVFDTPVLQDLVVPNEYEFQTKLDASEIYEPGGTAWSLLKLNNYHYTQIGGGGPNAINELDPQVVVVYPNPAQSMAQLPNAMIGADLQIIDASGRTVLSLSNISSTIIDLAAVEAGAYYLSILANDQRYLARLVVTK